MEFEISEEQRKGLYEEVQRITPHSDLYFPDHVLPIARNCFVYSQHLRKTGETSHPLATHPVICELAGLLHDIGYTKEYESNEADHIARGVEMAPRILERFDITGEFAERIVGCIWTHDGHLNRSRYHDLNNFMDNIIVNDVDAMQFFDWPFPSLLEFSSRLQPRKKELDIQTGLIKHANHTYNLIIHGLFKRLAKPKYEAFVNFLKSY